MRNSLIVSLIPLTLAFGADRRFHLFTAVDVGLLQDAYDLRKDYDPSGLAMNRTYVDVGFAEQLDENYMLSIGVGGIFWKAYEAAGGGPEDKVIKFGPGISNAFMKWSPSEKLSLTFGYFPYKYNMAAKNLGEYLFRTEAYPTIVYTGGWGWMNDALYRTVGAKLTFETGSLKQDIGLFGEYFNSPIYDITPAYIATWRPLDGLTLGGAGSLHRFINPNPKARDLLTRAYAYYPDFYLPEVQAKSTFAVTIPEYAGNMRSAEVSYSAGQAPDINAAKAAIWASDSGTLSALYQIQSAAAIPVALDTSDGASSPGRASKVQNMLREDILALAGKDQVDSNAYFNLPENAGKAPGSVAFDNAAIKLLFFFELDFNAMLGLDAKSMGAFNLYGEVAQLGLKNYPIFYTQNAERRPVMLGVSVPTMGLLDHISLEVEYLKNPNIASIASTYDKLDMPPDVNFRYRAFNRDDYKWSMHASRSFARFLSLHVQVANDHMRLKDGYAQPQYIPVTNEPSHWYWLTRIQWMI